MIIKNIFFESYTEKEDILNVGEIIRLVHNNNFRDKKITAVIKIAMGIGSTVNNVVNRKFGEIVLFESSSQLMRYNLMM